MSIKMKKRDFVIATSIMALVLAGVLAGLAGCQQGSFDLSSSSKADTGDTTDGSGLTKMPRIEIYWDGNESVNRAGQDLIWFYDSSIGASRPESPRQIGGKILNAPAGFDYLEWTIGLPAETVVERGIVRLPSEFANRPFNPWEPHYRSLPLPNGSSFALVAGAVAGTARIHVYNTNQRGERGTFYAYFDIRVTEKLRPLSVYVTETITATNLGFVKRDDGYSPATWGIRGGNATLISAGTADNDVGGRGFSRAVVEITGNYAGDTTYFVRTLQNTTRVLNPDGTLAIDGNGFPMYTGGAWLETEGPLTVIVSTTWYVGRDALGTYGFRVEDKTTLPKCLQNIRNYYMSTVSQWPGKGNSSEQHAVIRLTGIELGGLTFTGAQYPANIDLVNDSNSGQKDLRGAVEVGGGKTLTLTGIKTTGNMKIESGAQVTMLSSQTDINGPVTLYGRLTVENGTLSAPTAVYSGGTLTMTGGTLSGLVNLYGGRLIVEGGTLSGSTTVYNTSTLTVTGGTFSSSRVDVTTGGNLTIKQGTVIAPGSKVYRNGVELTYNTNPRWPPTSPLSDDFILTPP
ncbi:hypothetical protein FACS189483_07010 [Spirochaetia bacterium]|nr:hypothetical protein FACS189483_07010 [Spirochaetia bacterium]